MLIKIENGNIKPKDSNKYYSFSTKKKAEQQPRYVLTSYTLFKSLNPMSVIPTFPIYISKTKDFFFFFFLGIQRLPVQNNISFCQKEKRKKKEKKRKISRDSTVSFRYRFSHRIQIQVR